MEHRPTGRHQNMYQRTLTRARGLLHFYAFWHSSIGSEGGLQSLAGRARAIERRNSAAPTYATVTNDRLRLRVDICPLAGKRITCSITGKASVIIDCIRYNKCVTFLTFVRSRSGIIKPSHP